MPKKGRFKNRVHAYQFLSSENVRIIQSVATHFQHFGVRFVHLVRKRIHLP